MVTFSRQFLLISLLTIFLDQLSKYCILYFAPILSSSYLTIHLVTNTGAGFGIFQNSSFILGLVSLGVAIAIITFYHKLDPKELLFWAFLLGGTIGNMFDRLFRGFVIDFIDFSFWPAFNIADAAITIAVVGIILQNMVPGLFEKTNKKKKK